MNKEDLVTRISELDMSIAQTQQAINNASSNVNAQIGAREELNRWLSKLQSENLPVKDIQEDAC